MLIIVEQYFWMLNLKLWKTITNSQIGATLSQFGRDVLYVEVVYMNLLYSYTSDINVFYELHLQAFYFFKKKKKERKKI